MKGLPFITVLLLIVFAGSSVIRAQDSTKVKKQHPSLNFVDKNGDGYNDNAPDHDGDGIPNGLDPDWLKSKHKKRPAFRDLDGDGINDFLQHRGKGKKGFLQGRRPRIRGLEPGGHHPPFKQKMKGRK